MVVRLSAWENAWDTYGERNREAFFDTNYKTFKFFGEKLFPSVWQRVVEILKIIQLFFWQNDKGNIDKNFFEK